MGMSTTEHVHDSYITAIVLGATYCNMTFIQGICFPCNPQIRQIFDPNTNVKLFLISASASPKRWEQTPLRHVVTLQSRCKWSPVHPSTLKWVSYVQKVCKSERACSPCIHLVSGLFAPGCFYRPPLPMPAGHVADGRSTFLHICPWQTDITTRCALLPPRALVGICKTLLDGLHNNGARQRPNSKCARFIFSNYVKRIIKIIHRRRLTSTRDGKHAVSTIIYSRAKHYHEEFCASF